jgi:uncharacterized membrane protein YccF (DUF307 family)
VVGAGRFVLAVSYAIAGLIGFVLIITVPFGVQACKLAGFTLWPFGRAVVSFEEARAMEGAHVVRPLGATRSEIGRSSPNCPLWG